MISVFRMVRLGAKVAAWATPRIQEYNRQRTFNQKEAAHSLEIGNPSEAEKYFRLALQEKHGTAKTLELMLGLAEAQRRQNKLDDAENTARSAMQMATTEKNHSARMDALEVLSDIQLRRGAAADAIQLTREAIQAESKRPKPDASRLVRQNFKLAKALMQAGDAREGLSVFGAAAKLATETHGLQHATTADILSAYGTHLRQAGRYLEAQINLRKALEAHTALHGLDSPEAAADTCELAVSLEESGNLQGAMAEYEKALTLRERQVGGNVGETALLKVRLGGLYLQAGRSSAARELLIHAIRVLEKGAEDHYVLALELLAHAEEDSGRYSEAERLREKAASVREKFETNSAPLEVPEQLENLAASVQPSSPQTASFYGDQPK